MTIIVETESDSRGVRKDLQSIEGAIAGLSNTSERANKTFSKFGADRAPRQSMQALGKEVGKVATTAESAAAAVKKIQVTKGGRDSARAMSTDLTQTSTRAKQVAADLRSVRLNPSLNADFGKATTSLGSIKNAVVGLTYTLAGLTATVGGLAAAFSFIKISDQLTNMRTKLALSTGSVKELEAALFDVQRIAIDSRTPLFSVVDLYGRIAKGSKGLEASQRDVAEVTKTVAQAVTLSGGATQEGAAAIMQLGQALGSGRFQGDELRSVTENAIDLAQTIADGLGVSIGKMRELGTEGALSTKRVFEALKSQTDAVALRFQKVNVTFASAFSNIGTSVTLLFDKLVTSGPALKLAERLNDVALSIFDIANNWDITLLRMKLRLIRFIVDIEQIIPTLDISKYAIRVMDFFPDLETAANYVKDWGERVGGFFYKLYDDVIGHSYIPDLVLGVLKWGKYLTAAPLALFALFALSVSNQFGNMLSGIGNIWDKVVEKISDTSILGRGLKKIRELFSRIADAGGTDLADAFGKSYLGHTLKQAFGIRDTYAGIVDNIDGRNVAINTRAYVGRGPQKFEKNRSIGHDLINAFNGASQEKMVLAVGTALGAATLLAFRASPLLGYLTGLFTTVIGVSFLNVFEDGIVLRSFDPVIGAFRKIFNGLTSILFPKFAPSEYLLVIAKLMLLFSAGRSALLGWTKSLLTTGQSLASAAVANAHTNMAVRTAGVAATNLTRIEALAAKRLDTVNKRQANAVAAGNVLGPTAFAQGLASRRAGLPLSSPLYRPGTTEGDKFSKAIDKLYRSQQALGATRETAIVAGARAQDTAAAAKNLTKEQGKRREAFRVNAAAGGNAIGGAIGAVASFAIGAKIAEGMVGYSEWAKVGAQFLTFATLQFIGAAIGGVIARSIVSALPAIGGLVARFFTTPFGAAVAGIGLAGVSIALLIADFGKSIGLFGEVVAAGWNYAVAKLNEWLDDLGDHIRSFFGLDQSIFETKVEDLWDKLTGKMEGLKPTFEAFGESFARKFLDIIALDFRSLLGLDSAPSKRGREFDASAAEVFAPIREFFRAKPTEAGKEFDASADRVFGPVRKLFGTSDSILDLDFWKRAGLGFAETVANTVSGDANAATNDTTFSADRRTASGSIRTSTPYEMAQQKAVTATKEILDAVKTNSGELLTFARLSTEELIDKATVAGAEAAGRARGLTADIIAKAKASPIPGQIAEQSKELGVAAVERGATVLEQIKENTAKGLEISKEMLQKAYEGIKSTDYRGKLNAAAELIKPEDRLASFKELLSKMEGTTKFGYTTQFGNTDFTGSLDEFPNKAGAFVKTARGWIKASDKYAEEAVLTTTSAFGKYQVIADTWKRVANIKGLTGGPTAANQEAVADYLIEEAGALGDVLKGNYTAAIDKLGKVWASLPTGPRDQAQSWYKTVESLEAVAVSGIKEAATKSLDATGTAAQQAKAVFVQKVQELAKLAGFDVDLTDLAKTFDFTETIKDYFKDKSFSATVSRMEDIEDVFGAINGMLTSHQMKAFTQQDFDALKPKDVQDLVEMLQGLEKLNEATGALSSRIAKDTAEETRAAIEKFRGRGRPPEGEKGYQIADLYIKQGEEFARALTDQLSDGIVAVLQGEAKASDLIYSLGQQYTEKIVHAFVSTFVKTFFKRVFDEIGMSVATAGQTGEDAAKLLLSGIGKAYGSLSSTVGDSSDPLSPRPDVLSPQGIGKLAFSPDIIAEAVKYGSAPTVAAIDASIPALGRSISEPIVGGLSTVMNENTSSLGSILGAVGGFFGSKIGDVGSSFGTLLSSIGGFFGFGGTAPATSAPSSSAFLGSGIISKDVGGVIPGRIGAPVPMIGHGGEIVLNAMQQESVASMLKGVRDNSGRREYTINVTGDVSAQTRREIQRMLPNIANGVNVLNYEKGSR